MRPGTNRLPHAVVALAALLLALAVSAPASAARPCWKEVQDDWSNHALGEHTYAPSCYDQAIAKLPGDVRQYGDAVDAILEAKRDLVKASNDRTTAGFNPGNTGGGGSNNSGNPGGGETPVDRVLNAGSTSADGMPLPLLILGGIALALLAAGAVGVANRHLQTRRTPPEQ